MANYDIVVDTTEMATALTSVTASVSRTTNAVEEMQQEVCEIEKQSAEQICENVNRGFFALQQSQISQKKVLAKSRAESELLGLKRSANSLLHVKEQMARDFQRITARYTKLFQVLDEALRTRIYAVDKPVANISDYDFATCTNRVMNTGAPVAVIQREMLNSQMQLTMAQCKKNCISLIGSASQLIKYANDLHSVISAISKDETISVTQTKYMPTVFFAADDLEVNDSEQSSIIVGDEDYQKRLSQKIQMQYFEKQETFHWTEEDKSTREKIIEAIKEKIGRQKNFDKRTRDLMIKMLEQSDWKTLGDIQ